jgi:putative flippase GtrA
MRSLGARLADDSSGSQVARYLLVGAWNTFFGYLVFVVVWQVAGSSIGYGGTLVVTIVISVLQSYATQRWLVWRSQNAVRRELPRFLMVYVASYALNFVLLWVLVDHLGVPVLAAQALATALVVVTSFVLLRSFAFQAHRPRAGAVPTEPAVDAARPDEVSAS